ncbi:unannotated protein [freshwater metagenome]|uniref:Unannotated protein n=1 Tax=freshwater metagenome TaxID=449393 RepID=A0A6J7JHG3_9ZZZZ
MSPDHSGSDELSRRRILQFGGAGAFLLASGGLLAACSSNGTTTAPTTGGAGGTPRRGGVLRIAASGGGPADTIDLHNPLTSTDIARVWQLADPLARQNPVTGVSELFLAEELTPNADFTAWTVKIKKGVLLHNGREFTSDDVLATFQRIYDPKAPTQGAAVMPELDAANIKVVDKYTLTLPMKRPFNNVLDALAGYFFMMVGRGYDIKNPIATGPFKFKSFTPGDRSVFVRNDAYWISGKPYVDQIETINYADESSQVNALATGEVQLADLLSSASIDALTGAGAQVVISPSAQWNPIFMRTDLAPFKDVRVRQAFRLMADREEMNQLVIGGKGQVGNDIWSPNDSIYDKSIPQRVQDIAQAKSLLSAAGQSGLTLDFPVADIASGVVSMSQVFVQQAAKAGVTLNLKKQSVSDFFSSSYGASPIAVSFWYNQAYLVTSSLNAVTGAPFNETHFSDAKYDSLYGQAMTTKDNVLKTEIGHEMQKIDYETGGEIIPFFNPSIDAAAKNVGGLIPCANGLPLSGFDFSSFWME